MEMEVAYETTGRKGCNEGKHEVGGVNMRTLELLHVDSVWTRQETARHVESHT